MIRPPPRSTLFPYTNALPISQQFAARRQARLAKVSRSGQGSRVATHAFPQLALFLGLFRRKYDRPRSEEHTSELQSLTNLVCRLLLEKKKKNKINKNIKNTIK